MGGVRTLYGGFGNKETSGIAARAGGLKGMTDPGALTDPAGGPDVLTGSRIVPHPQTPFPSPGAGVHALSSDDSVGPVHGHPRPRGLPQLFEEQVAATPDAIAIRCGGENLTYGELNRQANRLAHHLRQCGVGPEVLVGLYAGRSPGLVIGLLAILKAGGAYLPVDPAYPPDRIAFMLEDAQAPWILTDTGLATSLSRTSAGIIYLDDLPVEVAAAPDTNPRPTAGPENLAYVIYTSGSTGRPKGTLVTHHNVLRLMRATADWFRFQAEDVWTLFHSHAFDFSVWELWGALAHGGRVVIVPQRTSRSPEDFYRLLVAEGVTVLNQTPSAFRQLIRAEQQLGVDRGLALRLVILGGEALAMPGLKPWFERHGDRHPRVVNMYGITETTVHVTYRLLAERDLDGGSVIGVPLPDLQIHLLDEQRQPVPVEEIGEIHVGGDGVARGYLNRPGLTAERFVPDPFTDRPGALLYRSGDLARRLRNGDLEYIGRKDQQVKMRGFRIELGEIEVTLGRHPSVQEAVVVALETEAGETRLVAYCVAGDGPPIDLGTLRTHLQAHLPDHMVPGVFVVLERMPLTPHGKTDRAALPAPEHRELRSRSGFTAPRDDLEVRLAGLWGAVLGWPHVGIHDRFMDLGGHSLLAMKLAARVQSEMGIRLPAGAVMLHPTVAEMAAEIRAKGRLDYSTTTLQPVPRDRPLPLSSEQTRMWLLHQTLPAPSAYNESFACRLEGPVDLDRLARAWRRVVSRHEILRTRFIQVEDGLRQEIVPIAGPGLRRTDLRGRPVDEREGLAGQFLQREARRPIPLQEAPLWRLHAVQIRDTVVLLSFVFHHAIIDDWSLRLLFSELAAAYEANDDGGGALPEMPLHYADYAVWQQDRLRTADWDAHRAFWSAELAGAPESCELPFDHVRPLRATGQGGRIRFGLDPGIRRTLEQLARAEGSSALMAGLAMFQVWLARVSGSPDVVVGSPVAQRDRAEVASVPGLFLNTVPVRVRLDPDHDFRAAVRKVRHAVLGALAHAELPFDRIVRAGSPARARGAAPLFNVMFVLLGEPWPTLRLPGLDCHVVPVDSGTAKFDLTLFLTDDGQGGWLGELEYSLDRFTTGTVTGFAAQLQTLFAGLAARPETPIGQADLFSEDRIEPSPHGNPPERLESAVRREPLGRVGVERVAKSDGDPESFRGRALNFDGLLDHLREQGVRVWLEGERLRYEGAAGVVTPQLLGELKTHKTDLVNFLRMARDSVRSARPPLVPRTSTALAPASFAQSRIWFMGCLEPHSTAYHLPQSFWLRGRLDRGALERALESIVHRHAVLRTHLVLDGETLRQRITPIARLELPVVAASGNSTTERERNARGLARRWDAEVFDLEQGPLFRVRLVELEPEFHLLWVMFHHAIADGLSLGVWRRELTAGYAVALGQPAEPRPELPIQYADFATWQQQWFQGPVLAQQLTYWRTRLAGAPERLVLPMDPRCDDGSDGAGAHVGRSLDPALVRSLGELGQQAGASPFMTLLAAFQLLLGRLAGSEDVVVGTPVAGRQEPETAALIGLFLNNLVLRADLSGNPGFRELLERVRRSTLDALSHQDLPFDRLVSELNPGRNLRHAPIFQVLINQFDGGDETLCLAGLEVRSGTGSGAVSKYDLTLYITPGTHGTRLNLVYRPSLFSAARMQGMLDQFATLLEQVVAFPDLPVGHHTLVTHGTRPILPDPTLPLEQPAQESVLATFARVARDFPDHVALTQSGSSWTFRELAGAVARRAGDFRASGVGTGSVVAVTGVPSPGLVAALLAVWHCGGVLLTLDPHLPVARRRLMVGVARVTHLVSVGAAEPAGAAEPWPGGIHGITANPELERRGEMAPSPLPGTVPPTTPAYIFFTSGTTGTPKAVLGTHAGLTHFLHWQRTTFGIGPGERVAQLTGLSFDVVLRDLFLPLTSGATLCLPPVDADLGADHVLPWLERERITLLHAVPALASNWLASGPPGVTLKHLRRIFFAGEPLTETLVRKWRTAFPEAGQIINLYGPTETTLARCSYTVPDPPVAGVQPVGFPLPQTQIWVLNAAGKLCGVGEPGEIVIRTPFRSRGYLNAPEETTAKFRPNPFRDDPEDLVYHTGDRGRYRPDGGIDLIGRTDRQVKVRGVRVELEEVNAALARHPGVKASVVVAWPDESGQNQLAAYVVGRNGGGPGFAAELRAHLAALLPAPFVPSAYFELGQLPLTENGKVNPGALPLPHSATPVPGPGGAPQTPTEQSIARIWSGLLPHAAVDRVASFFDLGGHSLLAIQMLAQVRKILHRDIPLRVLFEDPTIAGLARAAEPGPTTPGAGPGPGPGAGPALPDGCHSLLALRSGGDRPPLFIFPGGNGGDRELYVHAHLAEKHLGSDQPVYGFQRRGWDGRAAPHTRLSDLVRDYIIEIRTIQPQGPYFLVGDCIGGNVAFAVATRLQQEGESIGFLVLMDCWRPRWAEYQHYWLRSRTQRLRRGRMGRILFNFPRLAGLFTPGGREWFRAKLAARRPSSVDAAAVGPVPSRRRPGTDYWTPAGELYRRAATTHRPGMFQGRLHLVVSEGNAVSRRIMAWKANASDGCEVHELPGDHWHYLWTGAPEATALFRRLMDGVTHPVAHGP